jgi:hypothetical protein
MSLSFFASHSANPHSNEGVTLLGSMAKWRKVCQKIIPQKRLDICISVIVNYNSSDLNDWSQLSIKLKKLRRFI